MCTPSKKPGETQPCGFADFPKKIIITDELSDLSVCERSFTQINPDHLDEFLDYLKFPTITLPRGTVLCHSAQLGDFYNSVDGINLNTIYWWNEYFPGQASYGGGWFTFETPYGGPRFGVNFYYLLQDDLTLPFIPNDFVEKYRVGDPRYFSDFERMANKFRILRDLNNALSRGEYQGVTERFINVITSDPADIRLQELLSQLQVNPGLLAESRQMTSSLTSFYRKELSRKYPHIPFQDLYNYSLLYSGSHIIEGVEDWEAKGYSPIDHTCGDFADNLGIKMANLGFNGYISCDECEIYISHEAMKRVLSKPFTFDMIQGEENIELIRNIIRKGFELPNIPLVITKADKRGRNNKLYIPADEFLSHLENPEKFF